MVCVIVAPDAAYEPGPMSWTMEMDRADGVTTGRVGSPAELEVPRRYLAEMADVIRAGRLLAIDLLVCSVGSGADGALLLDWFQQVFQTPTRALRGQLVFDLGGGVWVEPEGCYCANMAVRGLSREGLRAYRPASGDAYCRRWAQAIPEDTRLWRWSRNRRPPLSVLPEG